MIAMTVVISDADEARIAAWMGAHQVDPDRLHLDVVTDPDLGTIVKLMDMTSGASITAPGTWA